MEERGSESRFRLLEIMVGNLNRAIFGDLRAEVSGLREGHQDHERRLRHIESLEERRVASLEQRSAGAAEAEDAERQELTRLVRREWTGGIARSIASATVGDLRRVAAMAWSVVRHVGGALFHNGP